mmetsp:Transcript_11117/g.23116  ORF Transcript_11117/g.23116 Transcript_11117/m.23116 type:complete len:201 (+) Transcript_11117:190-792(+)
MTREDRRWRFPNGRGGMGWRRGRVRRARVRLFRFLGGTGGWEWKWNWNWNRSKWKDQLDNPLSCGMRYEPFRRPLTSSNWDAAWASPDWRWLRLSPLLLLPRTTKSTTKTSTKSPPPMKSSQTLPILPPTTFATRPSPRQPNIPAPSPSSIENPTHCTAPWPVPLPIDSSRLRLGWNHRRSRRTTTAPITPPLLPSPLRS